MKRILIGLCAALLLFCAVPDVQASGAQGAIVTEAHTGRVLYERGADKKLPMASTTKIMTALLTAESGRLAETVTVPARAVGVEGSSLYLKQGEHLTVEELLYGLMLCSGNDAAVALADYLGPGVEAFVEKMNARAAELGAKNTHFVNPHGLHDPDHYTTARDLALIASAGMKNEVFARVVGTKKKTIPCEGREYPRFLRNKNRILTQYEGGNGVKTGFTKAAGRCLVSAAAREDMQLVCVVLNAPDMFNESMALLDAAFAAYHNEQAVKKGAVYGAVPLTGNRRVQKVEAAAASDVTVTLKEGERVTLEPHLLPQAQAPLDRGVTVGRLDVLVDGERRAYVDLTTNCSVKTDDFMYNLKEKIRRFFQKK